MNQANFQPLVDWCAQAQVGIFVPDIQAVLTEDGIDYVEYFSGILRYRPQSAISNFPTIYGTLWTAPPQGLYEANITIVLKPDGVVIGLTQSGGPGLITGDLNLGPSSPPDHMNVLFKDTDTGYKYALDLGKHWSINWRSVVARPGVGRQTGLGKGQKVPVAGG